MTFESLLPLGYADLHLNGAGFVGWLVGMRIEDGVGQQIGCGVVHWNEKLADSQTDVFHSVVDNPYAPARRPPQLTVRSV